jgi:hypothetical protein
LATLVARDHLQECRDWLSADGFEIVTDVFRTRKSVAPFRVLFDTETMADMAARLDKSAPRATPGRYRPRPQGPVTTKLRGWPKLTSTSPFEPPLPHPQAHCPIAGAQ